MQVDPTPLTIGAATEVSLPEAPLARVIAQVRFPQILAITKPAVVADLQEKLRSAYPILVREEARTVELNPTGESRIAEGETIWRMADRKDAATWRVSLGTGFVAIETAAYESRTDFMSRLQDVVGVVEEMFQPANADRIGLRYIDRLTGEALDRIGDMVQPGVLGMMHPGDDGVPALRAATVHLMTQVQLLAEAGLIQGRWGLLPPNTTHDPNALDPEDGPSWILDLDMYSGDSLPFESEGVVSKAGAFARHLYSVFRSMVTDEFLRFYGGKP